MSDKPKILSVEWSWVRFVAPVWLIRAFETIPYQSWYPQLSPVFEYM